MENMKREMEEMKRQFAKQERLMLSAEEDKAKVLLIYSYTHT